MKNRLLATTLVALFPLAALASAGDQVTDPPAPAPAAQAASFDTLDANKDGRISMPEASVDPKLVESFSTADKDGDGYLDSTEYANAGESSPRQ